MRKHSDKQPYGAKQKNSAGETGRKLQEKWPDGILPCKLPALEPAPVALCALLRNSDTDAKNQIVRLLGRAGDRTKRRQRAQHAAFGFKIAGALGAALQMLGHALHLTAIETAVKILCK